MPSFSARWLRRHSLLPLFALAGALALLAAACGGGSSDSPTASPSSEAQIKGALISPAVAKPDVTLTDTSGKPFALKQATEGYLTLVYLGYTNCPDVCPQVMADYAAAMKTLPESVTSKIKVIFVTTDPQRDTPDVLRKWLDHFSPAFIGLTGSQQQIDALQEDLHINPATKEDDGHGSYGVSHASFTFAFTANDNTAHVVYPVGFTRADLADDFQLLAKKGWPAS